ncbi:TfpX/TfpZ family type IV pilin accessory protein [Acinetobacter sp. YH12040]|uniref:TfpX/TfpZ family type IV pilin accessory protein n=1 Tax=Acinetobacter sp. YH12040 TaxID=2601048 RepID=UPI0015D3F1EA|nr:TfpX/TfpZ family type IV pilin accessory protein [Acinetobacter sp. YH12040]
MQDMKEILKEKFRAFVLHLMLSIFVLTLLSFFILYLWYPSPLLEAVNGYRIFQLVLMIDVILGPLLTFVVYRKNKKTLKKDLTIIVLLQVSALIYGVYSLASAKPVWIVFNGNKFELIQKNEIINSSKNIKKEYLTFNYFAKPKFVAVELSGTMEDRQKKMMDEIFSGISLAQQPDNYVKISKLAPKILKSSYPLEMLSNYNSKDQIEIELNNYRETSRFVPLKANAVDMTVLINKETGEVIKIVDLRPW